MSDERDVPLTDLAGLLPAPLAPDVDRRIHGAARAAFLDEARAPGAPGAQRAMGLVVPAALAAAVVVYLHWAVTAAMLVR